MIKSFVQEVNHLLVRQMNHSSLFLHKYIVLNHNEDKFFIGFVKTEILLYRLDFNGILAEVE